MQNKLRPLDRDPLHLPAQLLSLLHRGQPNHSYGIFPDIATPMPDQVRCQELIKRPEQLIEDVQLRIDPFQDLVLHAVDDLADDLIDQPLIIVPRLPPFFVQLRPFRFQHIGRRQNQVIINMGIHPQDQILNRQRLTALAMIGQG